MAAVTVLGMGAMGSRMAQRLLAAGHDVTVWSRSATAVGALAEAGARVAETPQGAVAGADVAISMVRDDEASRTVWLGPNGALTALSADAVGIESSTVSLPWIRDLGREAAARGRAFLEGPVVGSRPQAEAGQLVHLVGGDAPTLDRVREVLGAIGRDAYHVGAIGAGAAMKLAVNALLGIQVAAMGELLGLLRREGLASAGAAEVLGSLPVTSPAAKAALANMLAGDFSPLFPVDLVAKDLGYVLSTGSELPMVDAAKGVFERAMSEGLGSRNMTAVAALYRE